MGLSDQLHSHTPDQPWSQCVKHSLASVTLHIFKHFSNLSQVYL